MWIRSDHVSNKPPPFKTGGAGEGEGQCTLCVERPFWRGKKHIGCIQLGSDVSGMVSTRTRSVCCVLCCAVLCCVLCTVVLCCMPNYMCSVILCACFGASGVHAIRAARAQPSLHRCQAPRHQRENFGKPQTPRTSSESQTWRQGVSGAMACCAHYHTKGLAQRAPTVQLPFDMAATLRSAFACGFPLLANLSANSAKASSHTGAVRAGKTSPTESFNLPM